MEQSSACEEQSRCLGFLKPIQDEFVTNTAKLPIEKVKRLIAAVSKRPTLWERNYGNYGSRRVDQILIWQEISTEVNMPVGICRSKWGHLRDNFRKVFIRNTFSAQAPTSWRFYNDMRFMEGTIAENIFRQSRLKSRKRNLQLLQKIQNCTNAKALNSPGAGFDLHEHPLVEPTLRSSPVNDDTYSSDIPKFKKIKLEPQSSEIPPELQHYNCFEDYDKNSSSLPKGYKSDSHQEYPFEETAASESNAVCYDDSKKDENLTKGHVFTIEVFDNDQRNQRSDTQHRCSYNGTNVRRTNATPCDSDATLDAEVAVKDRDNINDTDRLFLLSLLPYLQRISLERKLHVRQKLQDVLIDEFG